MARRGCTNRGRLGCCRASTHSRPSSWAPFPCALGLVAWGRSAAWPTPYSLHPSPLPLRIPPERPAVSHGPNAQRATPAGSGRSGTGKLVCRDHNMCVTSLHTQQCCARHSPAASTLAAHPSQARTCSAVLLPRLPPVTTRPLLVVRHQALAQHRPLRQGPTPGPGGAGGAAQHRSPTPSPEVKGLRPSPRPRREASLTTARCGPPRTPCAQLEGNGFGCPSKSPVRTREGLRLCANVPNRCGKQRGPRCKANTGSYEGRKTEMPQNPLPRTRRGGQQGHESSRRHARKPNQKKTRCRT